MKYFLFTIFFAQLVTAAPLTTHDISNAVSSFVSSRFALVPDKQPSAAANQSVQSFSISKISPLSQDSKTIGYVTSLKPTGFVLMRSDDLLPALKLYSGSCSYSNLPPDFLKVIAWELSTEIEILDSEIINDGNFSTIYKKEWDILLKSSPLNYNQTESEPEDDFAELGPLLSTYWNQDSPYNYYAPTASEGPGGRAYAGCVAAAMAQILRYHKYPVAISADYTYTDNYDNCRGTHSASDAGLGDYQWEDMPDNLWGSTTAEQQAVAQLMYHCAVTVNMDFEADGSGAYSQDVPGALRNYFSYSSDSVSYRNYYSDAVWYNKINDSLSLQRPAYYAFRATSGGGHAIVCDGSRNGNEIHLNFGWGGSANAWYDINNVNGGGATWVDHSAIFNIAPKIVDLAYESYIVDSDDNDDGHISPGETVGIDVVIINTGGLDANNVTATLTTASAYVTLNPPTEIFYGRVYEGAGSIGATPYSIEIATNCPAGSETLQLIILNEDKVWTNYFDILVEYLPVIHVNPTNLAFQAVGISNVSKSVIVNNSGISTLIVSLFDDISSGSTNYSWADSSSSNGPPYLWRDISSIGTSVILDDNDITPLISFGFNFPFYGNNFSEFVIGANGGIGLNDKNIYRMNKQLPCGPTYAPAQFIAPFWDDLDPSAGGSIYYYAEANQLIVSWIDVPRKDTNTTETFQTILRKNGEIIFQYNNMNGIVDSATVGIQGGPQTGYNPPEHSVRIAYNSPFVTNERAVAIRPAIDNTWLNYTPKEAIILPEGSNVFNFTCNSENLTGGLYNAKVSLMHNDPTKDSIEVSIDFMVYKPGTLIKGNDQIIDNGENNPSFSDNTDFGEANIVIEAITNLFIIENSGTTNLSIDTVSIISGSSSFSIVEYPASIVPVDSSTELKLEFAPEGVGIITGHVQLTNSDDFNNPYSFSVIGVGVPEPALFWILNFGFWILYFFKRRTSN